MEQREFYNQLGSEFYNNPLIITSRHAGSLESFNEQFRKSVAKIKTVILFSHPYEITLSLKAVPEIYSVLRDYKNGITRIGEELEGELLWALTPIQNPGLSTDHPAFVIFGNR